MEAIRARRSPKVFRDRPLARDEIVALLELVPLAPCHGMTQPWRFWVLGEEAKRRYASLRAELKSQRVDEPDVREKVRQKVEGQVLAVPTLVAVGAVQDEDPMTREEDHAATWMGIQNLLLAATARGLGGYIRTGRILERRELRELLDVPGDQRLIALLELGEPAETPSPKPRTAAAELTTWVP